MIVVDVNIIIYYCLEMEQTEAARRLAEEEPIWRAPELWRSEMRNAVAGYMRRGAMGLNEALAAMTVAELRVTGPTVRVASERVLALASQSRCTAYDLEYVALAQQLQVTLVTEDKQLLRSFPAIARPLV